MARLQKLYFTRFYSMFTIICSWYDQDIERLFVSEYKKKLSRFHRYNSFCLAFCNYESNNAYARQGLKIAPCHRPEALRCNPFMISHQLNTILIVDIHTKFYALFGIFDKTHKWTPPSRISPKFAAIFLWEIKLLWWWGYEFTLYNPHVIRCPQIAFIHGRG